MPTTPPPNDPTPDDTARMTGGDPLGGQPPASGPESPSGGSPPPKRLLRSRTDRILAGVGGGLGRYFGVDPVLIRIALVVLAFFGGAGVLLYLAAALLVPSEPATAGSPPPERSRALVIAGVAVLVLVAAPFVAGPALVAGGLLFPLAFLVLAGLAVAWLATGRWPERDAGAMTRAALLGVGLLVLLCFVAFGAAWGAAAGGDEVVAGLVILAGAAILVGAFVRPVRWLVPFAIALAIPAGVVSAAGIELDGGYGEKRYTPGSAAELRDHYEIGAGELTLDLRQADLAGRHEIALEVGIGEGNLIVPDDVCVVTRADIGVGAARVFGDDTGGVDVDVADTPSPAPGNAVVVLDADIGIGAVIVGHDEHKERDWDRWESGDLEDEDNSGCASS